MVNLKKKVSGSPLVYVCKKLCNFRRFSILSAAFLFVLFFLFFTSCDVLFSPANPDYFDALQEELAWANAKRLNVRVEHIGDWGFSTPQQGSIAPGPRDIRQGFPFTIEFTPDPAYVLTGWVAYFTSDLDELRIDRPWTDDPTLLNDIDALGIDDITMPEPNSGSGAFTFTIHTEKDITLIPECRTEPRVTRTEPRNNPEQYASRAAEINIFFNGSLNDSTVGFAASEGANGIWITATNQSTGAVTNLNNTHYSAPEYSATGGFYRIIINPTSNLPPVNSLIEVTVRGIQNINNEPMSLPYTFSWKTPESSAANIISWSASYNETLNTINISWNTTGADRVITFYRVNGGTNIPLTDGPAAIGSGTISNVPRIDTSGVREGRAVSGINEYVIVMELYSDGIRLVYNDFKIWNIPGMVVNNNDTVTEISTSAQLDAIPNNTLRQFVLVNDITVSNHIPINSFQGRFYGNGHTITINSFSVGVLANRGLFGSVNVNAQIRDLRVEYENVSVSSNSTLNFGGITGSAIGNSIIRNVIVGRNGNKVTVTNTNTSSLSTNAGIITGVMESTVLIENCYAGLELEVNVPANGNSYIRAGGITGRIDHVPVGTSTRVMIDRVTVAGTVNASSLNVSNSNNSIHIGGIVGDSYGRGIIQNSEVSGTIIMDSRNTLNNTNLNFIMGGIIGRMRDGHILNCHFTGTINIPNTYRVARQTYIGGVAGTVGFINNGDTGNTHIQAAVTVKQSTASGDISFRNSNQSKIVLGGVVGGAWGNVSLNHWITFEDCEYLSGIIYVHAIGDSNVGGFAGDIINLVHVINCRSRAELINVDMEVRTHSHVGGFAGMFRGHIQGCYSLSPVNITSRSGATTSGDLRAGGFLGMTGHESGGTYQAPSGGWSVNRCYSTGSVTVNSSRTNGNYRAGGFIGLTDGPYNIRDCYSTGHVYLNRSNLPTAHTTIGGFIGFNAISIGHFIERCFSAGSVTAKVNYPPTGNQHYFVGGFIGESNDGTVRNNATLGSFVYKAGNSPDAGRNHAPARIRAGNNDNNLTNNFASDSMRLETSAYNGMTLTTQAPTNGRDLRDGFNVPAILFYGQNVWTNIAAGFGLSFNSTNWDFTGLVDRGYPMLRNVGGQR
ncbi:MAG: hypothetical protein LBC80_08060 [Treponema sp.]|jgi:hypothetical protein|nr:hypothetical protein [Treponema sp.]